MNRTRALTPWLFLSVLLVPLQTFAATLTGKVAKVTDGDTVTILVGTERSSVFVDYRSDHCVPNSESLARPKKTPS